MTAAEPLRPALFLDRDGVINVDHGYVHRVEDFAIIDGVFAVLRGAQAAGYALIVVTNQSGIARGRFSMRDYRALESHMTGLFAQEGVTLTAVYFCPHHPEGEVAAYATVCDCRKPMPGMILRAAREHRIDLARSILVGDQARDGEAGRAAGVGTVHVLEPGQRLADVIRFS